MKPWISIIVPVFNVEAYLRKCVDSLLAQTFQDIEIILVDDGSTDASGEICREYAQKYEAVTAIHKENGGLASARNEGMKYAKGEYIAFVDSDDWMEPDAYRILHQKCIAAQPDILNYGYCKVCDGKVIFREHAAFPEGAYDTQQIRNLILPDSIAREKAFDQVNLPVQLSACMCIYRRKFLDAHGLAFESERIVLNEDWLFNIRCLCHARSMEILHDCFYRYVTRNTSLSWSYKPDAYERRNVLFGRYREVLEESGRMNPEIEKRLRNFWMESVYCCYLIELNAPRWDAGVRSRMDRLCSDEDFYAAFRMLGRKDCTWKGRAFYLAMRWKLHGLMRLVYAAKKSIDKLRKQ